MDIFNQHRSKVIEMNEAQILGLLAFPLVTKRQERTLSGQSGEIFNKETPLGASLSWQLDHRMLERHEELFKTMGKGYIASYQLTAPATEDVSFLKAMDNQALIDFYHAGDWPVYNLCFEVTHPAWLEHVQGKAPFSYKVYNFGEPLDFDGGPMIWDEREQKRVKEPDYITLGALLFKNARDDYATYSGKKLFIDSSEKKRLLNLLEKSVEKGDAPSMVRLARCCMEEWSLESDPKRALELFRRAYDIDGEITTLRGMLQTDYRYKLRSFRDEEIQQWMTVLDKPLQQTLPEKSTGDYWDSKTFAQKELLFLKGSYLKEGYGYAKDVAAAQRILKKVKYLQGNYGECFKRLTDEHDVLYMETDVSLFQQKISDEVLHKYYSKEVLDSRFEIPGSYLDFAGSIGGIWDRDWMHIYGGDDSIHLTEDRFSLHDDYFGDVSIIMINIGWWSDKHDYWLSCDKKYSYGKIFDCYDMDIAQLDENSADEVYESIEDLLLRL